MKLADSKGAFSESFERVKSLVLVVVKLIDVEVLRALYLLTHFKLLRLGPARQGAINQLLLHSFCFIILIRFCLLSH